MGVCKPWQERWQEAAQVALGQGDTDRGGWEGVNLMVAELAWQQE